MISWIQRTFQQHFRTVFSVLLAVTIISFIFTIGASPGIGRGGPKTLKRTFFGQDLDHQATANRLFGDASLSVQLQTGFEGLDSSQLQEYGLQRIAALSLADQLRIPTPTKDEVTAYIKTLRSFAGSDGQFDASRYAAFRDSLRTNPRLSEGEIARVLADDVRISHLRELLSGPGYVLPGEVRDQLARTDSTWTLAVASVDYAAFKPDIPVPPEALSRFFTDNAFRYVVPPRTGVDYVEFRAGDFQNAVSVTDAEVRAFYDENPSRFPKPAEKKAEPGKNPLQTEAAKPADAAADFAAVQPQVAQALKTERAARLTAKAAADLAVAIYEQKLKPHTPEFDALLAARKLALKSAAPFDRDSVPKDLGWSPQIVEQALQLTGDRPVSDPLTTANGSLVLFWRETLPSFQPELPRVQDRVAADYTENERRKRFVALGQTLRSQLEGRLKAGDTFAKAAAATAGPAQPPLEVKDYPAFVRRQPPTDLNPSVLNVLERLNPGEVSDMLVVQDKGYFVYAQSRKLPDLTETSVQFAATRVQLAQLVAGYNQNLYLGEIVARELKRTAGAAP